MIPQRRADHGLTIHLPPEGLGMRLCRCRASFLRLLMDITACRLPGLGQSSSSGCDGDGQGVGHVWLIWD